MGVGVDVVEADPGAELGHVGEEVLKLRPHGPVPPEALPVPQVHPVGREVLGHEEELLRPRGHEPRRLGEHVGGVPGAEPSPQLRDDAEAAPVVAPLGELHVGVVPRGELDLGRDEVQKGSRGAGSTTCTASRTLSTSPGPVMASTWGWRSRIFSGRAPRQPVTTTLPFSLRASPMTRGSPPPPR